MTTIQWTFSGDNAQLANLCGPLDEHLRQISNGLAIKVVRHGNHFELEGQESAVLRGRAVLSHLCTLIGGALTIDQVQLALVEYGHSNEVPVARYVAAPETAAVNLVTRKGDLRARTTRQAEYIQQILQHDITFGVGPAGTGKTYLAVACAVDALERETVKRIVLTRPAIEAGERLGFLPGDLNQKVDPYLRPLYDALYDLLGFERTQRMFEKNMIEIAPLAYMRGRTLNHAFIILDEAQNTTPEQMKMFLTRIGFGSRAVVTGDPTQVDLPKHIKSGLVQAFHILQDVQGIAITHFTHQDVVRHPLVARIVAAYDAWHQSNETNHTQHTS